MPTKTDSPIIWRIALAAPPGRVFTLLDTDGGRERFWAGRSRTLGPSTFELTFGFGPTTVVEVLIAGRLICCVCATSAPIRS